MRLLYFTLGHSILDEQIRRQLVRIPEVLSEIRKVQLQSKLHGQDNVLAFLGLNDLKNQNPKGSFQDWVKVVQKGLLNRLRKTGFKYSGLFKRERLDQLASMESVFLPLLQSKSFIEVYVIGPGFDDLKVILEGIQSKYRLQCEVVFVDVINEDTKLKWFWDEIVEPSSRTSALETLDLSRH